MNIDEAINKAADHIERYPGTYNYMQGMVMRDHWGFGPGGYPSCMLARIGEYAGAATGTGHNQIAKQLLGYEDDRAYLTALFAAGAVGPEDTKTIPAAMRKIAKQYEGIPVPVRNIFNAARFQQQFDEVTL